MSESYRSRIARSYDEARTLMHGRTVWTVPNLRDTSLVWEDSSTGHVNGEGDGIPMVEVRYHHNPVVTFCSDGWVHVDFCGWDSPTTYARINACLPEGWRVSRRNYKRYITSPDGASAQIGSFFSITPRMLNARTVRVEG